MQNLTNTSTAERKYALVDGKTGITLATYVGKAGRTRASRRADKLDLEYGAVRYRVEIVW